MYTYIYIYIYISYVTNIKNSLVFHSKRLHKLNISGKGLNFSNDFDSNVNVIHCFLLCANVRIFHDCSQSSETNTNPSYFVFLKARNISYSIYCQTYSWSRKLFKYEDSNIGIICVISPMVLSTYFFQRIVKNEK